MTTRAKAASTRMSELLALAAELRRPELRGAASRALANAMGAEGLLIFVRDEELDLLLPAPGFPQTLPDGRRWRAFLAKCVAEEHAMTPLPFGRDGAELCADRPRAASPARPHPDKLEAIFEPFVQVRADLTRLHEGAGLGLAISRDLARGMGGELVAERGVNGGSTFVLTLPRG
jgi:hypothetical protein